MRKGFAWLVIFFLYSFPLAHSQPEQPPTRHIYFSPEDDFTQAIVGAIEKAKTSVLVQAYSFTSYPIAEALINAHKRNVKVKAILDQEQIHEKKTQLNLLARAGIPVSLDGDHAIAHYGIMIIDDKTVITGSFNFTNVDEKKNAENLLILDDAVLAAEYTNNWNKHRKHSERVRVSGSALELCPDNATCVFSSDGKVGYLTAGEGLISWLYPTSPEASTSLEIILIIGISLYFLIRFIIWIVKTLRKKREKAQLKRNIPDSIKKWTLPPS